MTKVVFKRKETGSRVSIDVPLTPHNGNTKTSKLRCEEAHEWAEQNLGPSWTPAIIYKETV